MLYIFNIYLIFLEQTYDRNLVIFGIGVGGGGGGGGGLSCWGVGEMWCRVATMEENEKPNSFVCYKCRCNQ